MSFDIPGQKYNPRAKALVLVMPEWLECKSLRIGFTADKGSTILHESSSTKLSIIERSSKLLFRDREY